MAEILFGVVDRDVGGSGNGGFGFGGCRGQGHGYGDGGYGCGYCKYGDGLGYGFGGFGNCYTDGSGDGWYVPVQGFGHGSAKQRKSQ